jgi:type IV secretory pathway TraG/TraD family ATPase VirD4
MAHFCRALLIVCTLGWMCFLIFAFVVNPRWAVTGVLVVAVALWRNRPAPPLNAHGTARWANEADARKAGLVDAPTGLILGHLLENDDA